MYKWALIQIILLFVYSLEMLFAIIRANLQNAEIIYKLGFLLNIETGVENYIIDQLLYGTGVPHSS